MNDHLSGMEAQNKILEGVRLQKEMVGSTMGPDGRVVLIDKGQFNNPIAAKDGVTVSKHIKPKDPVAALGANIVWQAANQTNDLTGDATTCATVLAAEMIERGFKYRTGGWNVNHLANGMNKAANRVKEELVGMSIDISKKEEIRDVATISSQNVDIGRIISEVLMEVGPDSTVTVDISQSEPGMDYTVVKGMQVGRGFVSPLFMTDTQTQEYKKEQVFVLISGDPIMRKEQLIPMIDFMARGGQKNILIVTPHIETHGIGSPIQFLLENKMQGKLNPVVVTVPNHGEKQMQLMEDIAVYTGGHLFSAELGHGLPEGISAMVKKDGKEEYDPRLDLNHFGTADRVISDRGATTLIGGRGDQKRIENHIEDIRGLVKKSSGYDEEFHRERLGSFTNGVGVIRVAAATEFESEELRLRVDDALASVRSATQGGVLPGGGTALLRCLPALDQLKGDNDGEQQGIKIVYEAIQAPAHKIADNAGERSDAVVQKIIDGKGNFGYDSSAKRYGDMVKFGIIDPTLAITTALENAVSVATPFVKMHGTITEIPGDS